MAAEAEDQLIEFVDDVLWCVAACDAMLCVGCSGWLNCVEDGAIASNRARSGVTVRKLDCCDMCDVVGLAAG